MALSRIDGNPIFIVDITHLIRDEKIDKILDNE
jgi:hypothetical protein